MAGQGKVNILLVDDQPGKLLSYEVILQELGENLLKATSGREALEHLLKTDVAVVLLDVCMPELDGFQLAAMIRDHPRFQSIAMIFISAIQVTDVDRLRGYAMGAVDYVPVPVVPEVLRAKVRVFAELYRKTQELERLNSELERRVAARTEELEASAARLVQSEQGRSLALAASNMGSWDWERDSGVCVWDEGQRRIFGIEIDDFAVTPEAIRTLIHPEDWEQLTASVEKVFAEGQAETEFRVCRPNGQVRWCAGTAAASFDSSNQLVRISGVTADITDRKEATERQLLLAREVDHRAKNALALAQSIVRMTRAPTVESYVSAVEGRIQALSRVHTVLSQARWQGADLGGLVQEELAPYRSSDPTRVSSRGPRILLQPTTAQTLALALHELVTNAAKYGALSSPTGRVALTWEMQQAGTLALAWQEVDGPAATQPHKVGFGMKLVIASIEGQLGGKVQFDWRSEGLRCAISVPHAMEVLHQHQAPKTFDHDGLPFEQRFAMRGNRIMLVEDEALVAMAMAEFLVSLGCTVVGPFSRCPDAMAAIEADEIHAAVLDVNLGSGMVYPLADALQERGVPFIFVTGYGKESIAPRFAGVPVLQKPVERQMLQRAFSLEAMIASVKTG